MLGLKRNRFRDLKGKRFGRLIVIHLADKIGNDTAWFCKCDCEVEKRIKAYHYWKEILCLVDAIIGKNLPK